MPLAFAAATLGGGLAMSAPEAPAVARGATPGAQALLAGEEPALGTTFLDLGEAPGRDLVGKPIRRVEVVIVGGRWTAAPVIRSVQLGEPASPEAARRIMREALTTGGFARANVEAFAEDGGVVLRLNALPRRLIASVQLGGGALDTGETLDAAGITVGGEVTVPRLDDIQARLRRFYEQRGFPAARVRCDTANTDQPDGIILSVEIEAGAPRTVARRVFVIDPAADHEVGNLKSSYKVGSGDRLDETALAEADRDLGEVLRQHGFFRAEVRHARATAGAFTYLYVYVLAGPRFVPAFVGNVAFDAEDLGQALNLTKAPDARPAELVERLRAFYVTRGFLDAEVSVVEQGKAADPVHYLVFTLHEHRQVRVTRRVFPCLTGDMSPDELGDEIGSFLAEELPGNDAFGPPDPRMVAKIFGPTSPIGGRGLPADLQPQTTYAPDTYERALKHVRDLLKNKGYLNAVVGPLTVLRASCSRLSPDGQCIPVAPREPLVARCLTDPLGLPVPEPPVPPSFTCQPRSSPSASCSQELTLRIPVALGPRTTLYDLAFDGNRTFSGAELGKIAELPLGVPLSSVELEAARLRLLDEYRVRGFAYADVRADTEPSPDRTRARVRFYVTERERVTVSDFVVKGATRTSATLILGRVALKKEEFYRQDKVRQTEERVATLGTFSSVSVSLEDPEVPSSRKRVVIAVVEQPTQYIEQRPGFSTGDGVRYTFEYGHRNLGGLAIGLTLRAQLSYLPDPLILDPAVLQNYSKLTLVQRLERRDTISVAFHEVGLGPLFSLTVDAIDLNDNQRDYGLNKEALIPTLTFRPFRQLTTQLGVSTEINNVQIFDDTDTSTSGLLRAPQGRTLALAERLAFTIDGRDNPFNPTKGVLFSTTIEHVNATPVDDSATVKSHFLRLTGRLAGYVSKWGVTLATSLGAGGNVQLSPGSASYPDRLFFVGGVDTNRAFLDSSLVPQDIADQVKTVTAPVGRDPLSGLPLQQRAPQSGLPGGQRSLTIEDVVLRGGDLSINPRVELRVPIPFTSSFQAGLFLDMGNVWVDPTSLRLNADFMRYGLGPGLRIPTPIGPLAFDYGFNLNRRAWEDVGAFHFSIGLF